MDSQQLVLLSLLGLTLMTSLARGRHVSERQVTGVAGKSIQLVCDLPIDAGSSANVRWIDYVYNTGTEPQVIYDSTTGGLLRSHPGARKFSVDSRYGLTISDLAVNESPGQYICESRVNRRTHQLIYQLTVCHMPRCSGVATLNAGDSTTLVCESAYSGNEKPQLDWYRREHDRHRVFRDDHAHDHAPADYDVTMTSEYGEQVNSVDEFDIRETGPVARQVIRLQTRHHDDGAVFTCSMTLADMQEHCDVTLNVTYLARDVRLRPHHDQLNVGDEITCHARGNPPPTISIKPQTTATETSGDGWRTLRVPRDFEGKPLPVVCTATNTVAGQTETVTVEKVYHVAVRRPDEHEPMGHDQHPPQQDSGSASDSDVRQAQSTGNKNSGNTLIRSDVISTVLSSLLLALLLITTVHC